LLNLIQFSVLLSLNLQSILGLVAWRRCKWSLGAKVPASNKIEVTMKPRNIFTIFHLLNGAANAFLPSSSAPRVATISRRYAATLAEEEIAIIPTHDAAHSRTTAGPDIIASTPINNENDIFQCHLDVEFWRTFQTDRSARENLREVANVVQRFTALGPNAISYLIRHAGRSGYFMGNAVLGTMGSLLHERLVVDNNDDDAVDKSGDGQILPFNIDSSVATRLVLEAFLCYEQDYARIREEQYREPWDMKSGHRQSSPINVVTQTGRFVSESIGTLARRNRRREEDKNIWITDPASPSLYPDYYRTAFHYQTDGWMSKRSADVYETSTETLFLGKQDAMQRTSLPPIVQFSKNYRNNASKEEEGKPMKVLEVACGTGRFMTFLRDNLPLDAECTAVDLSPYYLDAARENDAYWRKTRRKEENRNNRSNGSILGKDDIKPLRLIQSQAENLPFENESFDAVVCVYLFHELPRTVRAKASSEMSRVLKKGGVLVLTDSIQGGELDRPGFDTRIGKFSEMNEPFFADYCEDNLAGHFVDEELTPLGKIVMSSTKSLSFTK